ncbi:MAG TPA: plastocyanin/azurin family copper-binding protein [Rudaea sp.]|nr:plastocyanin/azurin family copper-binding protein [Rudaea sp.]
MPAIVSGCWLVLAMTVSAGLSQAHAATHIVNVGGGQNVFSPATVNIDAGDTVVFVNKGGYHNVLADDGSFRCARGCDGDGNNGNGNVSNANWVASVVFPTAGEAGYFCEIHGSPGTGMFGTVIVRAPPAPVPVPINSAMLLVLGGAIALSAWIASVVHKRRCARRFKP